MPEPKQRTNFDAIAESPKSLAAFLSKLNIIDAPWELEFQIRICRACPYEDCPDECPQEDKRDSPTWWLGLPEK